jgi:predicted nucleic acid-binding protein
VEGKIESQRPSCGSMVRKLKLPDAFILATAQTASVLLVTRNTRDFSSTDPQIRIPYTI